MPTSKTATEEDPLLPIANKDDEDTASGSSMDDASNGDANNDNNGFVEAILETAEQVQEAFSEKLEEMQERVEVIQEAVAEKATEIQEEIAEEVEDVKDSALSNLEQADDDGLFTMDMALTHTLSILPNDIAQVAAVVQHQVEDEQDMSPMESIVNITDQMNGQDATVEEAPEPKSSSSLTPLAFVTLGMTVVGLSSVGPILDLQGGCSPLMKIVWRQNGTCLMLLPLILLDTWRSRSRSSRNNNSGSGFPPSKGLTCAQLTGFGCTIAAYAAANICFVQSLEYTSVGNAVIFANSQAILLLLGKLFVGQPIRALEGFGAIVAFLGAILCSSDSAQVAPGGNPLLGNLIALGAGIGGVSYLILAQTSRQHFNLVPFMFWTMMGATLLINCFQVTVLGETITFDMHPYHGFWGFMVVSRFDRLPLELLNVVIWYVPFDFMPILSYVFLRVRHEMDANILYVSSLSCHASNFGGAFGLVLSMQYFSSLVIAVAGLLQPVVAEFLAFFIGVGMLPGLMGWIGNILVAGGTLAVVYPTNSSKGTKEETKELAV